MAGLQVSADNLLLDLENPRISRATSQREALQRIIEDQDVKLVILAESIVSDRLSPMDRWLVLKAGDQKEKYVVLEGNRRLATIRILNNPAVLNDLEVRAPVKRRLETLAAEFELKSVSPVDCYEVADRAEAAPWINQRHTGENKGRGIVNWGGVATARFRGRDPALQALEFVLTYGDLGDAEKEAIEDRFPITTLDRLLSTPSVRDLIGLEISESKLKTKLPALEAMKPLRKIVLDLANGAINVTKLKLKDQQIDYISKFGKELPDLAKSEGFAKSLDGLEEKDFRNPKPKPKPKTKPPVRNSLIPRDCYLTVSNAKIAEIVKELRRAPLADYPHSVSVLFRVFLETSIDHYLDSQGIPIQEDTGNGKKDKKLRKKLEDAIDAMVKGGVVKKNLAGVVRGIDDRNSPLFVDTLHNYVHNRFFSPTERDLKVAWDNTQLFFENIWK